MTTTTAAIAMTAAPPFAVGTVVFVQRRRSWLMTQSVTGCWAAVVLAVEPLPHHPDSPPRGHRYRVQVCGGAAESAENNEWIKEVSAEPCSTCMAAWTAWHWQRLAEGGA